MNSDQIETYPNLIAKVEIIREAVARRPRRVAIGSGPFAGIRTQSAFHIVNVRLRNRAIPAVLPALARPVHVAPGHGRPNSGHYRTRETPF